MHPRNCTEMHCGAQMLDLVGHTRCLSCKKLQPSVTKGLLELYCTVLLDVITQYPVSIQKHCNGRRQYSVCHYPPRLVSQVFRVTSCHYTILQYPIQDSWASIPGRHPTVKLQWWSSHYSSSVFSLVHHHHYNKHPVHLIFGHVLSECVFWVKCSTAWFIQYEVTALHWLFVSIYWGHV